MDNINLQIGSKVTVELEDKNKYISEIQNIDENSSSIYVSKLSKEGETFLPEKGTNVKVTVNAKICCYVFFGEVTEYVTLDSILLIKIARTSDIEKLQRRQGFRLEKSLPVDLKIYGLYDLNSIEKSTTIMATDISEGGVGIHWEYPLEVDRFIDCGLSIDNEYYLFRCRVARCVKEDADKYCIGLEIMEEDERYKDKVRKYIFERQTR